MIGKLLVLLDQLQPLADDWEDTKDEEAVDEVGHGVAKEVHRCDVIGSMYGPGEEFLDTIDYAEANHHPDESLPDGRVDPLQGREVVKSEGPSKDHSDQDKDDTGMVEGLVQAEVIVGILLEFLNTRLLVIVSVHDPVLGHIPNAFQRVIVHEAGDEKSEQEEKEVEFPCTTATHTETSP